MHGIIINIGFVSVFLLIIAILRHISSKSSFPYTVGLLLFGFTAQFLVDYFTLPLHIKLNTDIIYMIILPILLFEAAIQINIHQFKIQFKTITFLATFGIIVSTLTVALILNIFTGMPIYAALLFGSLISATDPIAVLAIFKNLGAPRRLGLIADGESMFNDATAVILFKILLGIALGSSYFTAHTMLAGFFHFVYIFLGSMVFGVLIAFVAIWIIEKIHTDRLIEASITIVLAYTSFAAAEHFFHLSGVIACVISAVVLGNFGKAKISDKIMPFVVETWEYLGFIALSIVFFLASFTLKLNIFSLNYIFIAYAIIAMLAARSLSVYLTLLITNTTRFFRNEPNVPLSWQHVLNWGGIRGVIPLVLVFSIPPTYPYYEVIFDLTMGCLLFTLFVNALTIKPLLFKLGLHLPDRMEELAKKQNKLVHDEKLYGIVGKYKQGVLTSDLVGEWKQKITNDKNSILSEIIIEKDMQTIENSLKYEALKIQKAELEKLLSIGRVGYMSAYEFEAQLDLQIDALEYPEVYSGKAVSMDQAVNSLSSLRLRLSRMRKKLLHLPLLKYFAKDVNNSLVLTRWELLESRMLTTVPVMEYLNVLAKLISEPTWKETIDKLREDYLALNTKNESEMAKLKEKYEVVIFNRKQNIFNKIIDDEALA
ncbi:sodium:proton antiporter [Candidatus Woesebacteria bacterium]|nr:MAG: sodium:proton antiporter [Candidatus Woesebacteria bacterium]